MPLTYILYKPLGAHEAGGDRGGGVGKDIETCSFSILVLKKIFLGLYFFLWAISFNVRVVVSSPEK